MSRLPALSPPYLLGFEQIDRAVERMTQSASDGFPPYDVERLAEDGVVVLRISLAVAGFARDRLEVAVEGEQLVIRGRQTEDRAREYLHRGIAARQFKRVFLLADGMQVAGAQLVDGLLRIDLHRPEPRREGRMIDIEVRD